jgi:sigma-B regulation protein RsbU (phosphoserine phosphatase)
LLFNGNGKIRLLEAQTPPLGVVPGLEFKDISLSLNAGSLYLYSDGVTEAQIATGSQLGVKGLAKLIKELQLKPPAQRLQAIVDRLKHKQKPLRDDMTLMLIDGLTVKSS